MTKIHLTADNIVAIVNHGARSFLHSIINDLQVNEQIVIVGHTVSSKGTQNARITVEITSKRLFAFPLSDGYRFLYDFRLIDQKITLK